MGSGPLSLILFLSLTSAKKAVHIQFNLSCTHGGSQGRTFTHASREGRAEVFSACAGLRSELLAAAAGPPALSSDRKRSSARQGLFEKHRAASSSLGRPEKPPSLQPKWLAGSDLEFRYMHGRIPGEPLSLSARLGLSSYCSRKPGKLAQWGSCHQRYSSTATIA